MYFLLAGDPRLGADEVEITILPFNDDLLVYYGYSTIRGNKALNTTDRIWRI